MNIYVVPKLFDERGGGKELKHKAKIAPLYIYIYIFKVIIIIDNFCFVLFSDVLKLTALYNILQHFLSFTNIILIIMTTNCIIYKYVCHKKSSNI